MDEYRNDGVNGFVMTGVSDTADTMTLNGEEGLRIEPEQAAPEFEQATPPGQATPLEQTVEFERVEADPVVEQTVEAEPVAEQTVEAEPAVEQTTEYGNFTFNQPEHEQGTYNQAEYEQGTYSTYNQNAFNQGSYNQAEYNQNAYDQGSYDQAEYNQNAYGESGYASWANGETTFHKETRKEKRLRKKAEKQNSKLHKVRKTITFTRRSLAALIICLSLASFIFGAGGSIVGHTIMDDDNKAQTTQSYNQPQDTDSTISKKSSGYDLASATGSNMTVQQINQAVGNSVVEIRTESAVTDEWLQQYVTEGAGSGVIISEDGYIMTNNHVINGASKIKVTLKDGTEYTAKLVGTDSINDVAVIKVDADGLTPAVYGNSSELQVGDLAVAIGNPLGELGGTVTAGIISATDRQLVIDGKTMHLLQTDSSINPGNSGGGLFNGDGQLIGLVVAKSSGSDVEGLGFAIPINTAAEVAQQLMDQGYVSNQPSTGMSYTEASDSIDGFDMFFEGQSSSTYVYIYSVESREAKQAGFMAGDIVLSVDGQKITSFTDLQTIVTSHKVGDKLKYVVERNGQQLSLTLTLQERKN